MGTTQETGETRTHEALPASIAMGNAVSCKYARSGTQRAGVLVLAVRNKSPTGPRTYPAGGREVRDTSNDNNLAEVLSLLFS